MIFCFVFLRQIVDLLKEKTYEGALKIQLQKDTTIRVINVEVLPDRGIAISLTNSLFSCVLRKSFSLSFESRKLNEFALSDLH